MKLGLICDRVLTETIDDIIINKAEKQIEKISGGNLRRMKIIWRDKRNSLYQNAPVRIDFENGDTVVIPASIRQFLKEPFTSPRCRICFDKLNIHADIVLGDPWEMSNIDWKNGESLVITRNELGNSLISEMIKNQIVQLNKASIDEVLIGQKIEARRRQVKTYLNVFKEHRWMLPLYIENLTLQDIQPNIHYFAKKAINQYIAFEKMSTNKIIRIITFKLNWRKYNLKKIIIFFYIKIKKYI
jgi:coenzyme F420-reducing hydrogenase beta subunit